MTGSDKAAPQGTSAFQPQYSKLDRGGSANLEGKVVKHRPKWQKKGLRFINSGEVQLFLGLLLMLSLFFADAWILGNAPDSQDDGKDSVLVSVVFIFCLEVIGLSIVDDSYLGSFFFWFDTLGTISILLDVSWISDTFLGGGAASSGSVLRATRAAKLGARYGRIMRLMKLIKYSEFLPCLNKGEVQEAEPTLSAVRKVSNELSATLSRQISCLVVVIVIVLPFLNYTVTDFSPDVWTTNLNLLAKSNETTLAEYQNLTTKYDHFYRHKDYKLRYVEIQSPWRDTYIAEFPAHRDVTREENIVIFDKVFYESGIKYTVTSKIDFTTVHQWGGLFGIILMILVIMVLFGFSASLGQSVEGIVVVPLQKMMSTLRKNAQVMIESMRALEKQKKDDEEEKDEAVDSKRKKVHDDDGDYDSDEEEDDFETDMLEKMVEKLARIVKHVLPPTNNIIMDENIDKATASWLNENYSANVQATTTATHAVGASHMPGGIDRILALSQSIVEPAVLNSWDFDVLKYTNEELSSIIHYIFDVFDFFSEFKIPVQVFEAFITAISNKYINSNTYHNFKHGCDVTHVSYRLMMIPQLHHVLSSLEVFSILVAAIGHDVGHPGVNNVFLVKSKHPLSLQHNDRSPLENMHCVVLYEVVSDEAKNIFIGLSASQWKESRKNILACILGTDMVHHAEQTSKAQVFFEVNGASVMKYYSGEKDTMECLLDNNNRLLIMELVIHCADISNPYKPFDICAKWADLVVEEFFSQGDREKEEKLEVSMMMDRNTTNLFNMQMGFIEFAVAPLINAFIQIFPPLTEIGDNMLTNFCSWAEKRKVEISQDETIVDKQGEMNKLEERTGKFREKMSFLIRLRESYQQALLVKSGAALPQTTTKVTTKRRSSLLGTLGPL